MRQGVPLAAALLAVVGVGCGDDRDPAWGEVDPGTGHEGEGGRTNASPSQSPSCVSEPRPEHAPIVYCSAQRPEPRSIGVDAWRLLIVEDGRHRGLIANWDGWLSPPLGGALPGQASVGRWSTSAQAFDEHLLYVGEESRHLGAVRLDQESEQSSLWQGEVSDVVGTWGGNAYFFDAQGALRRAPLSDSRPAAPVSTDVAPPGLLDGSLVWAACGRDRGRLCTLDLSDNRLVDVGPWRTARRILGRSGHDVYFVDNHALMRARSPSCAAASFFFFGEDIALRRLAFDASHVYVLTDDGTIQAIPKAGGKPFVIARSPDWSDPIEDMEVVDSPAGLLARSRRAPLQFVPKFWSDCRP